MDKHPLLYIFGIPLTIVFPAAVLVLMLFYPEASDAVYYFVMSLTDASLMVATGFTTLLLNLYNIFW
jgi:hypothetical protein